MKEDVLEQIVDDYLQFKGYFTIHNVRFKPDPTHPEFAGNQDTVASDVDVVGFNPLVEDEDRVAVVSCKAWQSGFAADRILRQLRGEAPQPKGRPMWKFFRELWIPRWSEAFRHEIERRTGATNFKYFIAVTKIRGDGDAWNREERIRENLGGNQIGFLTLQEMWEEYIEAVGHTPQPSDIGRLAQLLKAAGLTNPVT